MKTNKIIFSLILLAQTMLLFSQEQINFQGVLRGAEGDILASSSIDLRVRVFTTSGDPANPDFEEEHLEVATNEFGVFTAAIGSISSLGLLDFGSEEYQLEVSIREAGSSDYEVLATDAFGVAPYAMRAKTVEDVDDADADPTNEMQTLSKQGNTIMLSDGGEVIDETDDADADPTNEMQSLSFDANSNKLSISQGNEVTLPMGGNADADADPENELQMLSLLGNGDLVLSQGGGSVPLQQSPLVSTTDEDGDFAYRLNQKLGIGNGAISGTAMLDVQGPANASLYFLNEKIKLLPAGSGFNSFRIENDSEILAEFDASVGSEKATMKVEQIRIGNVKISNSISNFADEIYMNIAGSNSKQLLRLGPDISAINTERLFLNNISMAHRSSSNGDLGLRMANLGGNGHNWNMYVANGNGNLEFYHKGNIKARVRSSDGAWVVNSDRRYKTDIALVSSVLPQFLMLRPRSYRYKDDANAQQSLGFIAQEVEKLFPQLVHRDTDSSEFYGINYGGFGVLAVKAIQELAADLQSEKDRNIELEKRIEKLEQALIKE